MFGAIKRIFSKSPLKRRGNVSPFQVAVQEEQSYESKVAELAEPEPGGAGEEKERAQGTVKVAYSAILRHLPQELHGKNNPPGSAKFSIGMEKVVEQLRRGAVKVSFGELRRAAPVGVFRATSDQDAREVVLPLKEILPQVGREELTRRPQQRVQVSDNISDLFGRKGQLLAKLRVVDKKETTRKTATSGTSGGETAEAEDSSLPYPLPAAKSKAAPPPVALTPSPSIAAPAITMAPPPSAKETIGLKPPSMSNVAVPGLAHGTLPAGGASLPGHSASAPSGGALREAVKLPLKEFAKYWPEAVNREIVQLGLTEAQCHMPLAQIGRAVKNGVVQLPWKQVRSWIKPAPTKEWPAATAETLLEIPLKVVASLALTHGQIAPPPVRPPAVETPAPEPPKISPANLPNPSELKAHAEGGTKAWMKKVAHAPAKAPKQPEKTAQPTAKAAKPTSATVRVPLSSVMKGWPAALRTELSKERYAEAVLEVPREKAEPGLRNGKLEFSWNELKSWLKPTPQGFSEVAGDVQLDLPLPAVVPLLFQGTQLAKRAHAADEIPDLFNVSGTGEISLASPSPAPAEPAAAPAPAPITEAVPGKEPKDLAELFGEPGKRNWTPNEIVHKTTLLPNVSGALIALQDGLLVASCMPPNWKTETIAAFLPQIFGRMNQYAKELKMGELNSVSFTVDEGTLQIYNAGIIYFAALGQAGATLPTSLNLIARELSRHTR